MTEVAVPAGTAPSVRHLVRSRVVRSQTAIRQPSTGRTAPRTNDAAAVARNTIASAGPAAAAQLVALGLPSVWSSAERIAIARLRRHVSTPRNAENAAESGGVSLT